MDDYRKSNDAFPSPGTTLNNLKDQLYSLNMRMLLAIQNHDEEAQKTIKKQMTEIQEAMDALCSGGRHH